MNKVQLPFGMQDYLPDECYNKDKAESAIASVFSSYGYKKSKHADARILRSFHGGRGDARK